MSHREMPPGRSPMEGLAPRAPMFVAGLATMAALVMAVQVAMAAMAGPPASPAAALAAPAQAGARTSGLAAPSTIAAPSTTALGNSHAMGLWTPNPKYDTCSQALHDSFHVVAPDGLRYPTWHPPTTVDPATGRECSFGHEHGRDPKASALWGALQAHFAFDANGDGQIDEAEKASAGVPFGYVNERLDAYNAARGITNGMRHEDHVGHKIEWENAVMLQRNACGTVAQPGCWGRVDIGIVCDFLMKPHQGTHSKDAFANNMHELVYAVQCRNQSATGEALKFADTRLIAAKMVLFGKPGSFNVSASPTGEVVNAGECTPANSPAGGGRRQIPAFSVIDRQVLVPRGSFSSFSGVYEDWISSNYLKAADGRQLAYFDPHFAVFLPSRFFMPYDAPSYGITRSAEDKVNQVGRTSDLCYMVTPDRRRAKSNECDAQTNYGQLKTPIAWDDPRSRFNGVKREMYFNQTTLTNSGGVGLWHSDPFGNMAVPDATFRANPGAYAGFVRQALAAIDNRLSFPLESQALGSSRNYGHPTIHAPN